MFFPTATRAQTAILIIGQKRYESGMQHIWETNFIMDIQSANLDQREVKGRRRAHHPVRTFRQ